MLSESPEKFIKCFDDYSGIASEAKYKTKYGKELKIVAPKQMLLSFPVALAPVRAENTFENLLNEIRQIIYSLCQQKKSPKKYYKNIMNSIRL